MKRRGPRYPARGFGWAGRPGPSVPVRATDRAEDLVAWLLVTLGLLGVIGAGLVGLAAHDAALGRSGADAPTPVRAVLLADVRPDLPHQWVTPPGVSVPVRWTSADGAVHDGELGLHTPLPAGTTLTAWLDPAGRLLAEPPQHAFEAVALGIGTALTVAALVCALLGAVWSAVRRCTARRNDAAWAQEWARVEPVWSRSEG